ncbi:LysR family transcriptional regulator, partial [bacterium]
MMFRHLEAFIETARAGSVTQAAETLLLTQPTVSGQLKELEEELGVVLFNRMPRGVELTEAGKRFLPRAREILVARRKLLDEASEYKG